MAETRQIISNKTIDYKALTGKLFKAMRQKKTWNKTCKECNEPFVSSSMNMSICSDECRKARARRGYRKKVSTTTVTKITARNAEGKWICKSEDCNNEFIPTRILRAFCSVECQKARIRQQKRDREPTYKSKKQIKKLIEHGFKLNEEGYPILNCAVCKEDFTGSREQAGRIVNNCQVYCSEKCLKEHSKIRQRKEIKEFKCEVCNKVILSAGRRTTCESKRCITKQMQNSCERRKDKQLGKREVVTIECEVCKKEFIPKRKFRLRKKDGTVALSFMERLADEKQLPKFCSKECAKISDGHIKWALKRQFERKGWDTDIDFSQDRIENEKALLQAKRVWKEVTGKQFTRCV